MNKMYETSKRVQLFEFCENHLCPEFIRESIVDILGETLREGNFYAPIGTIFSEFCIKNNYSSILDIGSGSGQPIAILLEAMLREHITPPGFFLSDLLPNTRSMVKVADKYPGYIGVIEESVDATNIPEHIDYQAQTIISTFHHFDPGAAFGIVSDCVKNRKGIFIAEPFPRNISYLLPIAVHGFFPALANPFKSKNNHLKKLFFTYYFPLIAACGFWDGLISVLRIHSKNELMEMTKPFQDYEWNYYQLSLPFHGMATVFTGAPKRED